MLELCAHLEERGIASFSHGEGLLDDLRAPVRPRTPTRSLLCEARFEAVLRALPRAVVSAADGARLTQATSGGPIDLIATGGGPAEHTLPRFGLAPYAFAFRPRDESWLDPLDGLASFHAGLLEEAVSDAATSPFLEAPRRYWIAARLLAEHDLQPKPELVRSAKDALAEAAPLLPQAAPARREITRVLASERPGPALAFLHATGVSDLLVPGTSLANTGLFEALPPLPALRWALWLRGSATAAAMVRFRVPHALARRVERLQASHPIDRAVSPGRDVGLRKVLSRLDAEEVAALFVWRRLEIAEWTDRDEAARVETRLCAIEGRMDTLRYARERDGVVRALALDGRAVMKRLGAGPGPHVGRALAHLARFIAERPDANEVAALERELVQWARTQTNLLDAKPNESGSAAGGPPDE